MVGAGLGVRIRICRELSGKVIVSCMMKRRGKGRALEAARESRTGEARWGVVE